MVSPAEKNGADVVPNGYKTFATPDGNGVAFVGLGAFGDAKGTSTDVQYLARRTAAPGTSGWSTTAVSPPGGAPSLLALFFVNWPSFDTFTPDLRDGIYKSWKPLTDAPNVAGAMNLYQLRDLDTGEAQAELVSASAQVIQPPDLFTKLQQQTGSMVLPRTSATSSSNLRTT